MGSNPTSATILLRCSSVGRATPHIRGMSEVRVLPPQPINPCSVVSMVKLYLGFVYDDNGVLINHRSLIKVLFNPLLRPFRRNIVSFISSDLHVTYRIIPCGYVSLLDGIKQIGYDWKSEYSLVKKHIIW